MINEDIPGIEVAVQIAGTDVKEYDAPDAGDADEARPTCTKYIESVDNAFFQLRLQVTREYDWQYSPYDLCFDIYVDGKHISGRLANRLRLYSGVVRGKDQRVVQTGGWVLHKLQFTPIKTVDDAKRERVEQDMKTAKHLGVIEVRVRRGTIHGSRPWKDRHVDHDRSFELAEKSLKGKAVSHGTSLSSSEPSTAPKTSQFVQNAADEGPITKFVFLYRSHEALKRELIIPRTPTPPPPAFDTLTEEDLRRLARERFEQLQNQNTKEENGRLIKREIGEVHDLTGHAIVSKKRKGKMTSLESGRRVEVVDLSDDDDN